jgi:hypothetical protein
MFFVLFFFGTLHHETQKKQYKIIGIFFHKTLKKRHKKEQ